MDDACIAASKAIKLHTDNGKCEMPVRPSACQTRGTKRGPAHRPGRARGAAGRGARGANFGPGREVRGAGPRPVAPRPALCVWARAT